MEFNSNTLLTDILKAYPDLPNKLIKIDERFNVLKTPIGKMMIKGKTIADASKTVDVPVDELLKQLRELTK